MIIGIDLDGVVFDSEEEMRVYSELYDLIDLKQNSKRDNKSLKFQERFNWTEENIKDFLSKYHLRIAKTTNYKPGAIDVLNLLKKDGNTLIMITARGGLNKEIIEVTNQRLKKDNMYIFDKYYYKAENKEEVCIKEKVDVMIDDYYLNCIATSAAGVKTIYFKAAPSHELEENENIKVLYNWGEIYRYIKELEEK